jgi:endoglucanase
VQTPGLDVVKVYYGAIFQVSRKVSQFRQYRQQAQRWLSLGCVALAMAGCYPAIGEEVGTTCRQQSLQTTNDLPSLALSGEEPPHPLLKHTWVSYRDRFILDDGRVVDLESDQRTTSEGQAYAMLRSVLINDRVTFERTLTWAETNLDRPDDTLWSWHWGKAETGQWQIVDQNFATDADVDATTALILAARRWDCPAYMELAQKKLDDIWNLSVVSVTPEERQILPGPAIAFWQNSDTLILNPSYFSPTSYRLFAQVDPSRDWNSLIQGGYSLLEASSEASPVGLPSDWIALNLKTGDLGPLPDWHPLKTKYSFDAFRVWWRVALDASWFQEPRAESFLNQNLSYLRQRWQADKAIPASLSLDGQDLVNYEATAQYAMLYSAFQVTNPVLAIQIYQQKLLPTYKEGFWDNNSAYYSQNLAWFALLPEEPPTDLLVR